jgi:hypothetical protein
MFKLVAWSVFNEKTCVSTHGINLRNTCEGHMGTVGIRYGTFGKEYEVKQRTN